MLLYTCEETPRASFGEVTRPPQTTSRPTFDIDNPPPIEDRDAGERYKMLLALATVT